MSEVHDALRIGLVGLGNSGWFYHAEASIEPSQTCRLTAVCSRDGRRVREAEERFGCRGCTDWNALVADPEVDAVVLALPHHLHRPAALDALRAGKHVVVEKPMAVTTAEADEMIAAAADRGVVITTFQQRRWEADFRTIRRAVREGRIGDLWAVREVRSHSGKYRVAGDAQPHVGEDVLSWPHERAAGGGVAYLIGPHLADHVLHLVPQQLRTVAGRVHQRAEDEVEDYIDIRLDFDGDVLGQIEIFRQAGIPPNRWAVYGTEGTIVSPDGRTVFIHRFGNGTEVIEDLPPLRGCVDFYDNLYRAVRHGDELSVAPQDGRNATRLLELGLESARSGGQRRAF